MKLRTHLKSLLISSLLVTTLCVPQASALEYGFDGADDYLFADPTSQEVIYQAEDQNVNRSKTAALIALGFGTPTSYLRGSGEYLTPNLAPGAMSGGLVNAVGNNTYTDSGPGGYPTADILKSYPENISLARKRRRCSYDDAFLADVLRSVHV